MISARMRKKGFKEGYAGNTDVKLYQKVNEPQFEGLDVEILEMSEFHEWTQFYVTSGKVSCLILIKYFSPIVGIDEANTKKESF